MNFTEDKKQTLIQADIGEIDGTTQNRRVVKKKKKKTKKVKKLRQVDEDHLEQQQQQLTQSAIDESLDQFKDNMTTSYQSTSESRDIDQLSDTISDDKSNSSEGSDTTASSSQHGAKLLDRNGVQKFNVHLGLLLQKTLWMFARQKIFLTMVIFCPIVWSFGIYYLNQMSKNIMTLQSLKHGLHFDLKPMDHCQGRECVTVGYSIIGENDTEKISQYNWIDNIMQNVATVNNFIFQKDVKKLTVGTADNFLNYLELNPNTTLYSVVWCTSEWIVYKNISIPCRFSETNDIENPMIFYTIWYNKTIVGSCRFNPKFLPCPKDPNMMQLQNSVDNAIMKHLHTKNGLPAQQVPQIKQTYGSFPGPADRNYRKMDVMNIFGSYYYILGPIMTFMLMLQEIAKEKEYQLRQGLNVVGVSHGVYWINWLIVGTVINFMQVMVQMLSGYVFKFVLWKNCTFSILFYVNFMAGQSMVAIAMMLGTMVTTKEMANIIAYSVMMAMLLMQLIFSNSDLVIHMFYNNHVQEHFYVRAVIFFFNLIPTYNYSMGFGLLAVRASWRYSLTTQQWVEGTHFGNKEYYEREFYDVKVLNETITSPSVADFMDNQVNCMYVCIFMTWYLDHVISSNRGKKYSTFFLFMPSYWKKVWEDLTASDEQQTKAHRKRRMTEKEMELEATENETFDSAKIEKNRIIQDEKKDIYCDGLRIINLSKVYRKSFRSTKDIKAVSDIYLEVPKNELLCLLGHNGAGKSSLFNMLTGLIDPSGGTAKIVGLDIRTEQDAIRKVIGVVPQFDILWDQLTAIEHMRMFSKIKGVQYHDIEDESEALLQKVGLIDVKNAQCGSFSGGMKRRLSMAMSAIGNPRVIFFDEPTTGMDPVSRRNVWDLMQSLKRDKTIILTTHAMEEADVLADRIAVVVEGKIKCVGSPLNLKNVYGDGYKIAFTTKPGNEPNIVRLMNQIAPSNKFVDDSGGQMIFSIPLVNTLEITPMFRLIEEEDQNSIDFDDNVSPKLQTLIQRLKSQIQDCGISHATLEEVFMKVTGKKKQKVGRVTTQIKSPRSSISSEGELTEENVNKWNE